MFEFLATLCAGIFAGAAVFISLVQQPAARQVGDATAALFFPHMYRRGAPLQAGLAVVGSFSGLAAWLAGSGALWLTGSLLLAFVVPFTLLVIKPVNDRLLAPSLDPSAAEVPGLLQRWGFLHSVRSGLSTLSFVVFLLGRAAA